MHVCACVCVLPVLIHAQRLKEAVGFPVLSLPILDTESITETGARLSIVELQ